MRSVAVVPAAGSAERFGGRKLLTSIDGEPLLDRTIAALLNGGVDQVVVVTGPDARELERDVNELNDPRVWPIENPDPSRGMFSSLQAGFAEAEGDALVVLPADMPYVRSPTVAVLLDAFARSPDRIVSPMYQGKRGHPVILPPALRDEIRDAPAASTLHDVLKRHPDLRLDVDVSDPGVLRDVDVVSDLRR